MKILMFFILLIAGIVLILDSWLNGFVGHYMPIHGDGEEAMDDFAFTVLCTKAVLSAAIALALMCIYRKVR
ncbi:hypothetical protein M1E08_08625 [Erwinia sp. PK3-005]|uniref:Uncharacterized protein n=1 Tax=Mixta hanseatica TaxID=2872648 RepID=A0ABY4R580_9GAMM|nr:hypothetical protein [Mixta hanseatica]UQY42642.1 hypothetical protein K6958_11865 [Mixta hanseatica]